MKNNTNDSNNNFNDLDEDDVCDLDSSKICDSCFKCLGLDKSDYRVVRIDGLMDEEDEVEDYILQDDALIEYPDPDTDDDELDAFDVEYIEDNPKLKEEYDKKIDEILGR